MSDVDLSAALDTLVKVKISEALTGGAGQSMLDMMIEKAIGGEVEVRQRYGTKKVPFIEYHTLNAIEGAVEKAIRDVVSENQSLIEQKVRLAAEPLIQEMSTKIATGIVGDDWRANLNVTVIRSEEE